MILVNMNDVCDYVDIGINELSNIEEILWVEYKHNQDYDYYEAALDLNNIGPKRNYLFLLQTFIT